MLRQRTPRWRGLLALLLAPFACGGEKFTSAGQASAGSPSTAGSAGAAPSGGSPANLGGGTDSGEAGAAGASDVVGGAAGSSPVVCNCNSNQYCRDGSADCFDCANLSRLQFTTPERISTLSDSQDARFPRIGSGKTDLLYLVANTGMRYTSDASTSAGAALNNTSQDDSGPLLLGTTVALPKPMVSFNFAFDRAIEGQRSLWFGTWKEGLTNEQRAPSPFNADQDDYSVAVASKLASGVARLFWMTTRSDVVTTGPKLVTSLAAADASVTPVPLEIAQLQCIASDADLSPWVTSDGTLLMVSHKRPSADCSMGNGADKDLYTALLDPATGQPLEPAVPLNDVNSPEDDVDPSFSANLCDLYFASKRDGKFALYRAHRR